MPITDWLHDLDEDTQVRLGFTRGVPVGSTVWRLLTRLDDSLLTTVLAAWLHARTPVLSGTSAPLPHGYRRRWKALRGARRDGRQVHLLSALDTGTGTVLAQVTVDAKSNEILAFTPLLNAVERVLGNLTGVLFVADALHTQTGHADEVARRGDPLLVQVKARNGDATHDSVSNNIGVWLNRILLTPQVSASPAAPAGDTLVTFSGSPRAPSPSLIGRAWASGSIT